MTLRAVVTRLRSFRGICVESRYEGMLFGFPTIGGRIVLFVTPVEQFVTSAIVDVRETEAGALRVTTAHSEYEVVAWPEPEPEP